MARDTWDDEDESDSSSPPPAAAARRGKFDDEEDDSDVLESWDAAEDSEVEREKAKKAAEAKAKAEAEAKANHKSKSQRIEERRQENMRRRLADEETSDEEDEVDRRARLLKSEQDSDLKHAEDLFGSIGVSNNRGAVKPVTVATSSSPGQSVDLASLAIFNPSTKEQFTQLRDSLVPLLSRHSKNGQYTIFLQEFVKQISKDLPSEQIKKVASALTALSNEKIKEEKAAEKGGKKTKAAKTKTSLAASRDLSFKADTTAYDDGLDEDDFM